VVFDGLPIQVFCQYDLNRHSAAEIHAALRTHSLVRLDDRTMQNPYDEADLILANEPRLNEPDGNSASVEMMLEALRRQA